MLLLLQLLKVIICTLFLFVVFAVLLRCGFADATTTILWSLIDWSSDGHLTWRVLPVVLSLMCNSFVFRCSVLTMICV